MFPRPIVLKMTFLAWRTPVERGWLKASVDRNGPALTAGLLSREHDLKNVPGVGRGRQRSRALVQAFDEMTQSITPGPIGRGFFENLPAPRNSARVHNHPGPSRRPAFVWRPWFHKPRAPGFDIVA